MEKLVQTQKQKENRSRYKNSKMVKRHQSSKTCRKDQIPQ